MELGHYNDIEGHQYVKKLLINEKRFHHTHVIGKTGMGKSSALKRWAIDDMIRGDGLAFFDLHGHDIDDLLDYVPPDRQHDVILLDLADKEYPVAFNILDGVPDEDKPLFAELIVDAFKSIWSYSWGPQLEEFLRYGTRALLDNDASLLGLKYLLTKPDFQKACMRNVKDSVVRDFWLHDFSELMSTRDQNEKTQSLRNKIGFFISDPTIRNVIGQLRSSFSLADVMAQNKILLIKLPQGSLGLEKSRVMALLLLSAIHLTALRRPPNSEPFHLFIDEAHHFQGDTLQELLSGVRKFNVSLTLAHQYLTQFDRPMRDALLGTVETLVAFQTGIDDARLLEQQFNERPTKLFNRTPQFHANVFNGEHFLIQLISTQQTLFSNRKKIVNRCRNDYASPRHAVEHRVNQFLRKLK